MDRGSHRSSSKLHVPKDSHAQDLVDIIKAQLQRFNPIVGGGLNASVIHYLGNNQKLNLVIITKCCLLIKQGDLVLMDVGCELHGYVSVTHTWPPCGSLSSFQ
ncbi:hypothetical protein HN51_035984, partial [Arachis hypogaea]